MKWHSQPQSKPQTRASPQTTTSPQPQKVTTTLGFVIRLWGHILHKFRPGDSLQRSATIKPPRRVSALVPKEGQSRGDNILSLTGKSNNHHSLQHQPKGSQEGHPKSYSHRSPIPDTAIPPHCPSNALRTQGHHHPSHILGGDNAG